MHAIFYILRSLFYKKYSSVLSRNIKSKNLSLDKAVFITYNSTYRRVKKSETVILSFHVDYK